MRANSLVIQKFAISTQPLPMPAPTVEIVGRSRGIVAFFLSLIGFSPITRFILAGNELRCQSASLFGQSSQTIPINHIATLSAGVRKPVGNLVAAAVFLVAGITLSVSTDEVIPTAVGLVLATALVIGYVLAKTFVIMVYPEGGPEIALRFQPNVIEGIPIDVERALNVVAVIRDMVISQDTTPPTVQPEPATVPQDQLVPEQALEPESVPTSPEPYQPEAEESSLPSASEADEINASALFEEARRRAADGRKDEAVALLRGIVDQFPLTVSADQAKQTLSKIDDPGEQ